MNKQINIYYPGPDALGEGPVWHPVENKLYWIDIVNKTVNTFDQAKKAYASWQFDDYVGAMVPRKKGGLLVAAGKHIYHLDTNTGKQSILFENVLTDSREDYRFNDGKCDRAGRFWFGVASFDRVNPQGGLYCLDVDGTITQKEKGITISNGLGWSPDNKTFYFTDGLQYRIYQYEFDLKSATLSNRRVFLQLDETENEPDGLTVDSEGGIWQAQWNSEKCFHYLPDGSLQKTVTLPVQRPTSCIFGGKDYHTLFVTSCGQCFGEEKKPAPAGAVFAIDVDVKGLPEPMYAG